MPHSDFAVMACRTTRFPTCCLYLSACHLARCANPTQSRTRLRALSCHDGGGCDGCTTWLGCALRGEGCNLGRTTVIPMRMCAGDFPVKVCGAEPWCVHQWLNCHFRRSRITAGARESVYARVCSSIAYAQDGPEKSPRSYRQHQPQILI